LEDAEQRHRRQQHGDDEQERRYPAVKGLNPQPQMQPDAAMQPGDDEHRELLDAGDLRITNPVKKKRMSVDRVNVEIAVGKAQAEDMLQHQRRYQQSEREPQCLDPTHPQTAADVERPEGEREVDREGAVECDGADRAAPDPFLHDGAAFHRLPRDVAQAVIEKMQEHIRKHHQAAGQPKPADDRRPAPHQPRPAGPQGPRGTAPSTIRPILRNATIHGVSTTFYIDCDGRQHIL
jgi:hypothetical protein